METALATQPEIGEFPFRGECQAAVDAFGAWKDRLLDSAVDHPLETQATLVLGSAWVFYLAEKDANDDVDTYSDALHYIATCLSVGYANIFPVTQLGRVIAAIVMMVGPPLTAWIVEGRMVRREGSSEPGAAPAEAARPDLGPVLGKLDEILQELKAQRAAPEP
jgi:hypothetical protein